jgi:hypothetical protein
MQSTFAASCNQMGGVGWQVRIGAWSWSSIPVIVPTVAQLLATSQTWRLSVDIVDDCVPAGMEAVRCAHGVGHKGLRHRDAC